MISTGRNNHQVVLKLLGKDHVPGFGTFGPNPLGNSLARLYGYLRIFRFAEQSHNVEFVYPVQNGKATYEGNLAGYHFSSPTLNVKNGIVDGTKLDTNTSTIQLEINYIGEITVKFSDGTSGLDEYRGYIQYGHNTNNLAFGTDSAERMRLTSGGKFYVGTTNGAYGNDASQHAAIVNSTAVEYTLSLRNTVDAGGSDGRALLVACGKSTGGRLIFFERADGSSLGSITHNGSDVAYNTSSDYRLKENVIAISDGITRIKTLKPSRFNFKVDTDTTVDGFLAHEVTAVPEAITGTKDEVDSDNNPVYQGIDQSKLVPLLTAALQEAIAKIEVLETKVAALEAG